LFLGIHSEKDLKDIEQCRQMDTERQQFQEWKAFICDLSCKTQHVWPPPTFLTTAITTSNCYRTYVDHNHRGLQAATAQVTMGSMLWSSQSYRWAKHKLRVRVPYGPRALVKHKQPDDWPSGIIPPPLLVSRASISCTTSSISGRLSGFPSQHLRMIFANGLGQQRGMSGRKFCTPTRNNYVCSLCSTQIIRREGKEIA
jgi:hypothetical protein